ENLQTGGLEVGWIGRLLAGPRARWIAAELRAQDRVPGEEGLGASARASTVDVRVMSGEGRRRHGLGAGARFAVCVSTAAQRVMLVRVQPWAGHARPHTVLRAGDVGRGNPMLIVALVDAAPRCHALLTGEDR